MSLKTWRSSVARGIRRLACGCSISALITGAGVLMAAGAIVRFVSGSPYLYGMTARFGSLIPSPPLMSLFWMIWYGILGATFAGVMCGPRRDLHTQAERYRGGMLFLAMIFLGFLWYPLFFAAGHIWLATVVLLAVLALCILTALCYIRIFRAAGVTLFCHAVWLAWLSVVSARIFFL